MGLFAKVVEWIMKKLAKRKQPDTYNIVVVKINFIIHKDQAKSPYYQLVYTINYKMSILKINFLFYNFFMREILYLKWLKLANIWTCFYNIKQL